MSHLKYTHLAHSKNKIRPARHATLFALFAIASTFSTSTRVFAQDVPQAPALTAEQTTEQTTTQAVAPDEISDGTQDGTQDAPQDTAQGSPERANDPPLTAPSVFSLAAAAVEGTIKALTTAIFATLFFDITFGLFGSSTSFPFLIALLGFGAIFFTVYHRFINIRGFTHAINIVRGKYADTNDPGDIAPFQALTSALSATVGLGNIAGVAIAVKTGGPGAVFWMMVLGLFGMTAKFHESTLGQLFRQTNPDGTVSGGAMFYLDKGLGQRGLAPLGKFLAIVFAVFCIGGALGGGNMFQANQSFEGFYSTFVAPESESIAEKNRPTIDPESLRSLLTEKQIVASLPIAERGATFADDKIEALRAAMDSDTIRRIALPGQIQTLLPPDAVAADIEERAALRTAVSYGYGLIMATIVGIVVLGGITRIGAATSRIVPAMCLLYVLGCLTIILANITQLPAVIALILTSAFGNNAFFGGFLGVMVIGFQRAAFSSEAGLGSSAIAHAAAKQKEPVREGLVASLEPFVDTIIICFMTAMVVLITGAYQAPELAEVGNGTAITLYAFSHTGPLSTWFPSVLAVCVILFAFSTMISWCYYGERAWGYLFGFETLLLFRIIFVICVMIGSVYSLGVVIDFSDAMLLSMAVPNIIGGIILAPLVRDKLTDYWTRYKAGDFDPSPPSGSDIKP